MNVRGILLPALIVLAAGLGGYYWYDFNQRHGDEVLLKRAEQYWEARRLDDLLTAYELEAETANGQLAPDEVEVLREWGLRVRSFKLGAIEHFGDHAEIEVTTESTLREFTTTNRSQHKDIWTFIKGQWYHGTPEKGGAGIRKPGTARPQQAPEAAPAPGDANIPNPPPEQSQPVTGESPAS